MKNFSVNTADFDSLSISGESPIVQSDLGTAPNQIPLNKDLGSLAYMNAPQIEDLNVDTLELREIAAEMSETAVDVFVYDTRKDSDGGAWRSRTQHTSWYNEPLNTATRGSRREFPAVAVIVAEADKVTIYDGDDPDLSMWMVFEQEGSTAGTANLIGPTQASLTSVFMLNGIISITENTWSVGLITASFISEGFIHYWETPKNYNGSISQRNDSMGYSAGDNEIIVNPYGNDVAMTVLPNAPIDAETGLPIPTIAVATDGGVSVIKDDGSVVDKGTTGAAVNQVQWMGSGRLVATAPLYYVVFDDPFVEESDTFLAYISDASYHANPDHNDLYQVPNLMAQLDANSKLLTLDTRTIIASTSAGLNVHEMGEGAAANNNHGIATYITSKYNTGWMPGDIKLATLSDTKNETVGVDETTELVTNGGFNSDYTGWYGEDANLTNANHPDSGSNSLLVTPTASLGKAMQDVTTVSGQKYVLSADIAFGAGCTKITIADNTGGIINRDYFPADGNRTVAIDFDGNASISNLQLVAYGGPAYFDNVSIKETGELITNGDFSTDSDWEKGTGWSISGGFASISNSTAESHITQEIYVEAGKIYAFEAEVINRTSGTFGISWDNGTTQLAVENNVVTSRTSDGQLLRYFKASSSGTVALIIYVSTGATGSVDNASFREVELDRSINNKGLQIFGEINKTPVAPGADLVAYSGFSENNYLVQPYNQDLDFGTGDFCIMCWGKKTTSSAYEEIFARSTPSTIDQCLILQWKPSGAIRFFTANSGSASYVDSVYDADDKGWHFITAIRRSGVLELYINAVLDIGVNQDNGVKDVGAGFISSIGYRVADSTHPATNSSIALFRISATTPTPEQIAKIYRDEKALFTDGAQATLYGTSDAVTALAYDDKTELLHVGTSSGRSDFAGLRRINNTTTAVTTSISASNNLIAEQ
jgi:hypothetical protein